MCSGRVRPVAAVPGGGRLRRPEKMLEKDGGQSGEASRTGPASVSRTTLFWLRNVRRYAFPFKNHAGSRRTQQNRYVVDAGPAARGGEGDPGSDLPPRTRS